MSFVRKMRVDDRVVTGYFEKVPTEADSVSLTAEQGGQRWVTPWGSGSLNSTGTELTIDLPFNYLLNKNQLEVYWQTTTSTDNRVYGRILDQQTAESLATFDPLLDVYYEEVSSSRVILHNIGKLQPQPFFNGDPALPGPGANNTLLFSVPHTAAPATNTNRLIVDNQGDNVAVELLGAGDGIMFTTRTGKKILLRPDDGEGIIVSEL